MIPDNLRIEIAKRLGTLKVVTPISGGDINQAARIETDRAAYFVKWNPQSLPRMFEVEARGLQLLADAHAVHIPQVIAVIDEPPALILEWIDLGHNKSEATEELGRLLAQQHRSIGKSFGLDHDNYIGSNPQFNKPTDSWIDFFREHRLGAQAKLARERGHLTANRSRRLDELMDHLDNWINPKIVVPSLLHGDLWGGNYLIDSQGQPVLIDPATYYGDREAEIAFTELFGGFGSRFYAAYKEAWPLDPGYAERRDVYNLYPLLNHLNLFGEGYGGSVDAILLRYAR